MKNKIDEIINLISNREDVKEINSIIIDDIEGSVKIYYTVTDEYAKEYNLDFMNRIFEYNPNIRNLSHTREYADMR